MAGLSQEGGLSRQGVALRLSLTQQVTLLAVVIVGFIVLGTVLQRSAAGAIDRLFAATSLARQQANAAGAVLDALQDAETGQRGFLLTQRAEYLAPYTQAVIALGPALEELTQLNGDTPGRQLAASGLRKVALDKLAELRETLDLAQAGNLAGAIAVVQTDRGKALMDDARARVAAIGGDASDARARTEAALRIEQRYLNYSMQSVLVIGLLLLGAALLAALVNRARMRATQAAERLATGRLQAAVERIRDGIAVFDAGDRLILTNERLAPALGLTAGGTRLGVSWRDFAAAVTLEPAVLTGSIADEPTAQVAMQGTQTLEIWRSRMPGGGQILAVADITRRVQAEEIARQLQKMEVLGQMTGGVAHDFNNLLQVISANLELITRRIGRAEAPDPWLTARLEAARSGVTRGSRLTRHLLAFARRQPLVPEPLDPARILFGMEDMVRRSVAGGIAVELVVGGGLWTVRADANQLENALLNLALNARDAMTHGGTASGRLTVEASNASLDDMYAARAADVTAGQYVMFAVTDTGTGMTAAQLTRATEPFYTTKPEGQGTGLGLSMVFGFAKQSCGHFQLYSEPGRGTTARLYLPRTHAESRAGTVDGPAPQGSEGELVMVVEDDALVRAASVEAVRGLGYRVIEAETADAAMAMIDAGTRPAVLFTDVVMPGRLTSRELADRAGAVVPGLAVLFTSGYTQNSIVHNGQLDPGITLLSKPWRAEELAVQLQAVIGRARALALQAGAPTE